MKFALTLFALSLLSACAPIQSPPDSGVASPPRNTPSASRPDYAPRPGDKQLTRGNVYIDSVEVLAKESYPPQFSIALKGNLPTPCHEVRINYTGLENENKIVLEVYSVTDPNKICAQVLQPFEQTLEIGSFSAGHYTVWVNGQKMAEFDA